MLFFKNLYKGTIEFVRSKMILRKIDKMNLSGQ